MADYKTLGSYLGNPANEIQQVVLYDWEPFMSDLVNVRSAYCSFAL